MDTNSVIYLVIGLTALVLAIIVAALIVKAARKKGGRPEATGASTPSQAVPPDVSSEAASDETGAGSAVESAESVGSVASQSGSSQAASPESASPQAAASAAPQLQTPESSTSRLIRLRARLSHSANPFGKALFTILSKNHLTDSDWEDVEDTLLLADVGADASSRLVEQLKSDVRVQGETEANAVRDMLKARLLTIVDAGMDRRLYAELPENELPDARKPSVIIMVGVNGTGKTTTAGKLARFFVAEGKSVMMAAADTFRAAAADQLETWGNRVGVKVVRSDKDGADPASVAFEAAHTAQEQQRDVLIVDTAGRLQNKANLMQELGKIRRVIEKTAKVDEVLLVLDATTGQNGMAQAKVFAEAIGITGIVLTKLDGSARGGIVISVQRELGVPVKLVGLGEGPDDLTIFDPATFVDGILALN
ncbi:signal recognition particle-docking protein FtsY [Bifidobacterium aquikefiricola]|uniref:Signal recognition particle receptor FtsY n=1 Tax=Bifidobacterium aquikefiricola TaxID=3059038 RepID=A0AB39U7R9_9BIFI